jgi:hypothetical protein
MATKRPTGARAASTSQTDAICASWDVGGVPKAYQERPVEKAKSKANCDSSAST